MSILKQVWLECIGVKTFLARTLGDWRSWLAEHHDSESEVWLVFYKQHTGVASLGRKDALDEALCFGWVDSLVRRLDDERYALKFTPRRSNSRWSDANRQHYAELVTSGRMQPAGLERPPTDRSYAPAPPRRPLPTKLPAYIDAALKKRPTALRFFGPLPREERRRYIGGSIRLSELKRKRGAWKKRFASLPQAGSSD